MDINNLIPDIGYYNYRGSTPDWKIEESVINFIDVSYIVGGNAVYRIDDEEIILSAGDLLCIPKGRKRSAGGTPEIYAANFQLTGLNGAEAVMPLPLLSHIGHHPDILALYKELNGEWLRREPGYIMKARAYFMLILHRYFELVIYNNDSVRADPRVKTAIRFMTDRFAEPLTVRAAAEAVGLTPVYFGALFKQATGSTFRQALISIRLNHAENLLRFGERNVNETARECGFSDLFYFSRVYKQIKGVPPSQARRQRRED
ncbi:MAG: AraC family transcriptional regulator [Oscillospiraceae bacterium]|jgi:AraC-like DNA-binding protein|nr:AraC family transcriptional regulator [Oscillospiraceae bacterium]